MWVGDTAFWVRESGTLGQWHRIIVVHDAERFMYVSSLVSESVELKVSDERVGRTLWISGY